MEKLRATFKGSYARLQDCPADGSRELAFIGRSNVGKSSLINALTGNQGLAKTSATPGKTVTLNFFGIPQNRYLVDLPGYGFAKRSKWERERLRRLIVDYVTTRAELFCLFVLIDSRLSPQTIDLEFIQMLGEQGVPFAIVFTKVDKQSAAKTCTHVDQFFHTLAEQWDPLPPHFLTSSATRRGIDEMLTYIAEIGKN